MWLCLAIGVVCGCRTSPSQPSTAGISTSTNLGPFNSTALQEGDVVQVTFEGATNLNTIQRVPIGGKITMPFVGEVQVLNKTPLEVKDHLTELYKSQLRTAEITVQVPNRAAVVYVAGAVLKPGPVPMNRPLSILDAVMEAGGVDPIRAKLTKVTVVRDQNGKHVMHSVNLKRMIEGQEVNPFYLQPYDKIYVPEKTFNF
jgi:polysaccharide export outer membrane protein